MALNDRDKALIRTSLLLNAVPFTSHVLAFTWLLRIQLPVEVTYGSHFQYLTTLALIISGISFFLGLSADLRALSTSKDDGLVKLIHATKERVSSVAGPAELLVTFLYFGIKSISTDLVLPKWARLPFLLDISLHINPTIFQLFDFLVLSSTWRITLAQSSILSSGLAVGYWVWLEKCHAENGFYPYPILDQAGFWGRIGLFIMSAALLTGNTFALKGLHARVNGIEQKIDAKKE